MIAILLAVLVSPAPPRPSPSPASKPAPPDIVATVGGEPVTLRDLEAAAGPRLFQMKQQQYQAQRQLVEEAVNRRLLQKEAATRSTTPEELIKQEVEAKVPAPTEAETKAVYEQNRGRFGATPEAEALKRVESGMRQQRTQERRAAFFADLRKRAVVRILLDPPRQTVESGDNPARGPADAPVMIVEFSDFQCPFCSRVNPTLKRLEESYPGKIRLVFRDFPLNQIHPQAAKAAEAAGCAEEQGKFWPMHDVLFTRQSQLQPDDLKRHAAEIGLDAASFNECLDSGRRAAEVQKDAADAERYGVSSTPAFFVNGRMILGAQPYDEFVAVVEDELARAGTKSERPARP